MNDESVPADSLTRTDLAVGSTIAAAMATAFILFSPGLALVVTFVPGIAVAWAVFFWLYVKRMPLPSEPQFVPLFVATLGVQFLHFAEEYVTGFPTQFPALYGGEAIPNDTFVVFNMTAYAIFTWSCLLAFRSDRRFLLIPPLFFVVYGTLGNAISHTWWSLWSGGYFPGLVTAQAYWILAPLLLFHVLRGWRPVVFVAVTMAGILVLTLTTFISS